MGSRIGNVVYSSGIGVRNPDGGSAPTPEVLVHAVAAVPNGLTVEHMPWAFPLFKAVPEVRNGEMIVPQSPGQGIEFSEERLAHSALS